MDKGGMWDLPVRNTFFHCWSMSGVGEVSSKGVMRVEKVRERPVVKAVRRRVEVLMRGREGLERDILMGFERGQLWEK